MESREAERVVARGDERPRALIVALGMPPVDARRLVRERAVDIDRDRVDLVALDQRVEVEEQLLRAPDAEGRHDELRLVLADERHVVAQTRRDALLGRVVAVAVGALREEHVDAGHRLGVLQDGHVALADVAREEQAARLAAALVVEADLGGAENVAGVVEGQAQALGELDRLVVVDRREKTHRAVDVLLLVQQLEGDLVLGLAPAVDALDVVLLDVRRVAKHQVAEVDSGGRGVDAAAEALPDERRQVAAVVHMGVGEDDRLDVGGTEREVAVALEGLLAVALEGSAVEEEAMAVPVHEVHGAGGGLSGAEELEIQHGGVLGKGVT